jgi:hypothetical protein
VGSLLGSVFAVVLCLGLLFLAGVIVWFGITGAKSRKGSRDRLHRPQIAEIEAKWRVKLPPSLETYFRSPIVDRSEFYLAPPGQSEWWYIESFLPLTVRDLPRWISITNVPGIPIALDGSKGTYYLPFESLRQGSKTPVLLRLPGSKREDRKVASSFEEFISYEPKEPPAE